MAYITINKQDFKHNIHALKSYISSISCGKTKLACVLKDNAYGHGIRQIASLCKDLDIESSFTKNFEEALKISKYFKNVTFFYGLPTKKIKNYDNIIMTIHSKNDIFNLKKILKDLKNLKVELKVNIGMNRNGVQKQDLEECLELIIKEGINLFGVFGHNGYGDCNNLEEFNKELEMFSSIKNEVILFCNKNKIKIPRFHVLNSSGIFSVTNSHEDLARVGISIYGYLPSTQQQALSQQANQKVINLPKQILEKIKKLDLKPILKLYAQKVTSREILKDEKIGYCGASVSKSKEILSSYDIGYGDGFFRLKKDMSLKLANGKDMLCVSSMDCFSAFLDEDEVCVMDDASYVARVFDTIPYEVLTHLSSFLKRKII